MIVYGKVKSFNGKFGEILTQNMDVVDFDIVDVPFNQQINVGDVVSFRIEEKQLIKIARNILVMTKEDELSEQQRSNSNLNTN